MKINSVVDDRDTCTFSIWALVWKKSLGRDEKGQENGNVNVKIMYIVLIMCINVQQIDCDYT